MSTQEQDFQWTDETVLEFLQYADTHTRGLAWCTGDKSEFLNGFKKMIGEKRSPEYEVLELICNNTAKTTWERNKSVYKDKEEWVKCFLNANIGWAIHSVRRLSDGEVFELGETVQHVDGHYSCTITEFYRPSDERGEMWFHWDGHKEAVKNLNNFTNLPTPKPLFTTEDKVEVLEESTTLHGVHIETWIPGRLHFSQINTLQEEWKWFSFPHNRDRYILENKPVLSVRDVWSLTAKYGYDMMALENDVINLAKEKL